MMLKYHGCFPELWRELCAIYDCAGEDDVSASRGDFDLAAAGARAPTWSPAIAVESKHSIPKVSPFAKGQPSSSQGTLFQGHVPRSSEAMDATMLAAQERMEDDEMVVDPASWPHPSESELERIAGYM